ncbi:MAG: hypothetical protein MI864_20330 [Pseudomonadales bacterium]|nr:hypothetical protein [Pseudomonadales bacterium]
MPAKQHTPSDNSEHQVELVINSLDEEIQHFERRITLLSATKQKQLSYQQLIETYQEMIRVRKIIKKDLEKIQRHNNHSA